VNIKGWKPENYTREYFGNVTLQQALAMSLNTIPAKLIMEMGPRTVVRTAQRLGISSGLRADASLALGTSEVTPMEMTTAYAAFANGGTGVIPHAIIEVKATDGTLIYRRQPQTLGQVAEPAIIGTLNRMMRETLVSGTARKSDLPGWQAAGKTGTTQEHKDAWFVGYTAHLVASVWVGNDEGEPMKKVTGSGLPAELWASFMREAHNKVAPQPLPGLNEGGWLGSGNGTPVAQPGNRPPAPVGDSPMRLDGPSAQDRSLLSRLFGR
jgi:penicillin-binding protein 1A